MSSINEGSMHQSIVKAFDDTSSGLKSLLVDLSGNKITSTLVGGKRSLDVNVADLTVSHTDDSIKIGDGINTATIRDLATNDALNVAIVDAAGAHITSFGGGTQYTEDAVAAADPVGNAVILVRKDVPAITVSTDGDNIAQRGTNYGAAFVQILTSTGAFIDSFGGGTQYADGAVRGTATGTLLMVDDGVNIQSASGTTAGVLKVDLSATTANATAVKVDGSAVTQPISATSLPLPTNASTSALQTTGNTSLSSIDTKVPTLGQALAAASVPVVLTAAQLSTLTPLTSVAVTNAGTFAVQSAASQAGTWTVQPGNTPNTVAWKVDGSAVTQPVSIAAAVTVAQATAANLNATIAPLTNASVVKAQLQDNAGAAITVGQKVSASSVPVVLASDGLGSSAVTPMFISGTINASSSATATNYKPQYTDSQSAALSQSLTGQLRTQDDTAISILETLKAMLLEMRVQNTILHSTLNSRDDLDLLRNDAMDTIHLIN